MKEVMDVVEYSNIVQKLFFVSLIRFVIPKKVYVTKF
jgi:hypothetical protein